MNARPLVAAAYHEAGHAVAAIALGAEPTEIRLRSPREARKARESDANTWGVGYVRFHQADSLPLAAPHDFSCLTAERQQRLRDMVNMIVMLAGPISEAKYRRRSALKMAQEGGISDVSQASHLAVNFTDPQAAFVQSISIARQVVRSHWKAVDALADWLWDVETGTGRQAVNVAARQGTSSGCYAIDPAKICE